MKIMLIIIVAMLLSGCFHLTGVEHSVYGGVTRSYSGGEIYTVTTIGHQEDGGSWQAGTMIKTIWGK